MVYGLWFMVYGLWFMFEVYGLWFMVLYLYKVDSGLFEIDLGTFHGYLEAGLSRVYLALN